MNSFLVAMTAEKEASLRKGYKDPNLHAHFGVTLIAVFGISSATPASP